MSPSENKDYYYYYYYYYYLACKLRYASADLEGGQGVRTPHPPGKSQVIWVSIGNKQLDPHPPPPHPTPPPTPGKSQISLNFGYHVNFKDFIPNFVCVLTNERYKTYQTGF